MNADDLKAELDAANAQIDEQKKKIEKLKAELILLRTAFVSVVLATVNQPAADRLLANIDAIASMKDGGAWVER